MTAQKVEKNANEAPLDAFETPMKTAFTDET